MREKKEINIQVGEQIKLAREQAKLTQEQLAERVEVSPQYISDLERGVVGVSIATLRRICITLNVSSDQLLFAKKDGAQPILSLEQCSGLTDKQTRLLSEIIFKYIEAVQQTRGQE